MAVYPGAAAVEQERPAAADIDRTSGPLRGCVEPPRAAAADRVSAGVGNDLARAAVRAGDKTLHAAFNGIRMKAGHIYTVAGDGTPGGPFPGALPWRWMATATSSSTTPSPTSCAAGGPLGHLLRQQVTVGHAYVIADRQHGPAGLGQATRARLHGPDAIAVGPDGRLLIALAPGSASRRSPPDRVHYGPSPIYVDLAA